MRWGTRTNAETLHRRAAIAIADRPIEGSSHLAALQRGRFQTKRSGGRFKPIHNSLAHAAKAGVRRNVIQRDFSVAPDRPYSNDCVGVGRNYDMDLTKPAVQILCGLVGKPKGERGRITTVIQMTEFDDLAPGNEACLFGVVRIGVPDLHWSNSLRQ